MAGEVYKQIVAMMTPLSQYGYMITLHAGTHSTILPLVLFAAFYWSALESETQCRLHQVLVLHPCTNPKCPGPQYKQYKQFANNFD